MTQLHEVEQIALLDMSKSSNVRPGPFIKWAGGKTQLLHQFDRLFPTRYNRYYEPFVGSGAVFFHLLPSEAVLSDANPNLIAVYRHIQYNVEELIYFLYDLRNRYHTMPPQEQEREYYRIRELYNDTPSGSLEKAAFLIFLNKTGYNGLYRESKRGGYNVPFGRYDNPAMFDESNLRAVSQALQHVTLLNTDFSSVVETAQEGDFVYFDPPYVPLTKTASFTSYTMGEFTQEQQSKLADVARHLAHKGVLIMLSNSSHDAVRELYRDWYVHEVKANRAVNSKPDLRGKITELVVTTYEI
ncbi:MAG TPA: DNA adenine methylase [Ktedonobacteraceae bacterium]|nr:DNA adenine methylase [Ktedonobacteraceae bacterium]